MVQSILCATGQCSCATLQQSERIASAWTVSNKSSAGLRSDVRKIVPGQFKFAYPVAPLEVRTADDSRKRKRSQAAAKKKAASQKKIEEFNNQKHWVQCNLCDKWRVLPPGIEFDMFESKKNKWDPERASCDAPEEEW